MDRPPDVSVTSSSTLEVEFGSLGSEVDDRAKRTKAQKEWWVLRRVLLVESTWSGPLYIWKTDPPAPDFLMQSEGLLWGLEVTEGTTSQDQREMSHPIAGPELMGSHGGRGCGGYGGSQPESEVAGDIVEAICRKREKSKSYLGAGCQRLWLLIYVNSNPGMLVHIEKLREALASAPPNLGDFEKVTVLCGRYVLRACQTGWEFE